jgi:CRP-like cAMP-binding protein
MTTHHPSMSLLLRRLEARVPLSDSDRSALLNLPSIVRTVEPATYLVREGEEPKFCCIMLSGFSFRHKITGEGARQIIAVHMAGEFVDLQNSFLEVSDHNVQALTRCEVAFIPRQVISDIVVTRPALAKALWFETLVDASIFREWVVNVGRRDAMSRVAHLLCELAMRLEVAGLARDHRYDLPMTQEQIADCTGLTPVHVNRTLKEMDKQGFIVRNKRSLSIQDWERMRAVGDFNARYLHIESVPQPEAQLSH